MDDGASRLFTSIIHEFAQSLGKENFYLIGEITGGRQRAFNTLEITGMDAALGIDDVQDKIEYLRQGIPRSARTTSTCSATRCSSARSRTPGSGTRSSRPSTTTTRCARAEQKSRFAHDEGPGSADQARLDCRARAS